MCIKIYLWLIRIYSCEFTVYISLAQFYIFVYFSNCIWIYQSLTNIVF